MNYRFWILAPLVAALVNFIGKVTLLDFALYDFYIWTLFYGLLFSILLCLASNLLTRIRKNAGKLYYFTAPILIGGILVVIHDLIVSLVNYGTVFGPKLYLGSFITGIITLGITNLLTNPFKQEDANKTIPIAILALFILTACYPTEQQDEGKVNQPTLKSEIERCQTKGECTQNYMAYLTFREQLLEDFHDREYEAIGADFKPEKELDYWVLKEPCIFPQDEMNGKTITSEQIIKYCAVRKVKDPPVNKPYLWCNKGETDEFKIEEPKTKSCSSEIERITLLKVKDLCEEGNYDDYYEDSTGSGCFNDTKSETSSGTSTGTVTDSRGVRIDLIREACLEQPKIKISTNTGLCPEGHTLKPMTCDCAKNTNTPCAMYCYKCLPTSSITLTTRDSINDDEKDSLTPTFECYDEKGKKIQCADWQAVRSYTEYKFYDGCYDREGKRVPCLTDCPNNALYNWWNFSQSEKAAPKDRDYYWIPKSVTGEEYDEFTHKINCKRETERIQALTPEEVCKEAGYYYRGFDKYFYCMFDTEYTKGIEISPEYIRSKLIKEVCA